MSDRKNENVPGENLEESGTKAARDNYKTLQQLSVEYGITRQGVKARLDKMLSEVKESGGNESDYITRGKQGAIYVHDKGLKWLAEYNNSNTPMQVPAPNIELELLKLEQTEQTVKDLRKQIDDLEEQREFLRRELSAKNNQINGLTAALMQTAKALPDKSVQDDGKSSSDPETVAEDTAHNAPQTPKTPVSVSDDEIRAELSKRSFLSKLKLLFS